jgi:hypothetical protein
MLRSCAGYPKLAGGRIEGNPARLPGGDAQRPGIVDPPENSGDGRWKVRESRWFKESSQAPATEPDAGEVDADRAGG